MRALTFLPTLLRVLLVQSDQSGWALPGWQENLGILFSTPQPTATAVSGRGGLQALSQRKGLTRYARTHSAPCPRSFK